MPGTMIKPSNKSLITGVRVVWFLRITVYEGSHYKVFGWTGIDLDWLDWVDLDWRDWIELDCLDWG